MEPLEGQNKVEQDQPFEAIPDAEVKSSDVSKFDIPIKLSTEDKEKIVQYLEENLPKMKPPEEEIKKILGYFAMYEMTPRPRNFPYENAPSLSSTDAHDKTNEWLDTAELAFFTPRTTFTIDREETNLNEESVSRIERTYHRKFFQRIFQDALGECLFESSFLGVSVASGRESYDIQSKKKKVIIRNESDLAKEMRKLSASDIDKARKSISKGELFVSDVDSLEIVNIGPVVSRIDQTKFWYPRNTKKISEWKIVSELEFYTKSSMLQMASQGEFDAGAVDEAIENRRILYNHKMDDKRKDDKLPEYVKCNNDLDSNWGQEIEQIKKYGDAYEDEFAVYRVTMLYGVPTEKDLKGRIKSWIEVAYCPASSSILGAKYCQDGFPYFLVRYRKVPYRIAGPGIAQARYNHNAIDSDLKSLALASVEQDVGSPLLLRNNSSVWASGFRAYPSSVTSVDDVDRDVKFLNFPDKSRVAVAAMGMVIGSSPMSNMGAGYASGKREELLQNEMMSYRKARIYSISMDLDKIFNFAWKIHCRLARFNTQDEKIVDFVEEKIPDNKKLYILEEEMDPNIVWTSVVTAASLSPQARLQEAMMKYQFFFKDQPVMVNNPKKTIAWLRFMSDFFGMDNDQKSQLLPTEEDFASYQAQLGAMGGENQGAPSTPISAQSSSTPFHRPAK